MDNRLVVLLSDEDDPWANSAHALLNNSDDFSSLRLIGLKEFNATKQPVSAVLLSPKITSGALIEETLLFCENQDLTQACLIAACVADTPDADLEGQRDRVVIYPHGLLTTPENLDENFPALLKDSIDSAQNKITPQETPKVIELHSPSDSESVKIVKSAISRLIARHQSDEALAYKTRTGFLEAIDNSSVHGNGSDPKMLLKLIFEIHPNSLVLDILDSGFGFDYQSALSRAKGTGVLDAVRARHVQGRAGGIGIRLMLESCRSVEYSDDGRRIRIRAKS